MDKIKEAKNVSGYFVNASKLGEKTSLYLSKEEWEKKRGLDGSNRFKKRVIGFFRKSTTKPIKELANLLAEVGAVDTFEQGKELIPKLYENYLEYGGIYTLGFFEVENNSGEKAVRIVKYIPHVHPR
ncbi:MAG: hypothetical protein ACOYT4_01280 [Nanoarchaeota archaeon]